jgi:NADP-dependent 3-hydroxy acid dehydrogenase YdfG
MKGKRVLITGASAGIGRACAELLDEQQCELFLLARRQEELERLSRRLKGKHHIITGDITLPATLTMIEESCQKRLDILINNAGLALGKDKVEHSTLSDWDTMIDVNLKASVKVAHKVLPWMLDHGGGDIVMLGSIAGHYTYSGGAIYCATKHAIDAFTRSLREETCGRNIRVMQISPGMVETDFSKVRFRGDQSAANAVYKGMTPLTPVDIAEMIHFMLTRPRHVVIDEIITMPSDQGSATTVVRRN